MKISYNWLKDYIDTDLSAEEAAKILTDIGLEVESIERVEAVKGGLEGVVVGEVLTCEKHPDADKLKITTVDYGEGPVQIVCGAPNVAAGQKVVVATVGCTLWSDPEKPFKISKSKIRGVESMGMLCAEDELGLGTSHEGIIVLAADAAKGKKVADHFNLGSDYVFEIGLTPNRIDAASHIGVARDLAAYLRFNGTDAKVKMPDTKAFKEGSGRTTKVRVEDGEGAPRYLGLTITGVKVKPSPEWLQKYLRAIGINPKNNVVDITNFILHELGQPMHAFDADKVTGGEVVVRKGRQKEKFVTLDGVERTLTTDDLMICNAEKPMCIAGIFGGTESGVTEQTRNVFLEGAYFNPRNIRRSARRHGLNTDASFRYERGTDPAILEYAIKRAAILITDMAGGTVSSAIIDVTATPPEPFKVEFSVDRAERLIGKKIGAKTMKEILEALDIKVAAEKGDTLTLLVPAYRVDVRREADVVEEILRIYGYNNIEEPEGLRTIVTYAPSPDRSRITNIVADLLSDNGYNEAMSNSLTKGAYYEELKEFPAERSVRILNPLSNDLNVMRQTLLFGLLEAVILNTNHKNSDLKLYEFGNTYVVSSKAKEEGAGLNAYHETGHLAIVVTGLGQAASWNSKAEQSSFYTLKRACERIFRRFGIDLNEASYASHGSELYSDAVEVRVRGKNLLTMGVIAKSIRKQFDIKADVYYAYINFDTFVSMTAGGIVTAEELTKYPGVSRDLSLLIDKSVTFSQLRATAFKTEKSLLKNVALFDVYEGDKLPHGKKSYALNFILEDTTKTLTDNVIEDVMKRLAGAFEKNLKAEVRK